MLPWKSFFQHMEAMSVSIPPLFRCPISLELMKDPVTLSTGVSYDRESIERWFQEGHFSCPSTMQVLDTLELTPNHTLRRLIQGWCFSNLGQGFDRTFSPPEPPANTKQIEQALLNIKKAPKNLANLRNLGDLARKSEKNRSFIAASGGPSVLISSLFKTKNELEIICGEEVLEILGSIPIHEAKAGCIRSLESQKSIDTISWFLCKGGFHARLHAAQLLHGILTADQNFKAVFRPDEDIFDILVLLLRDSSALAIITALEILLMISPVRRNRIRVVEAGAIATLIEILTEAERNTAEKAIALLEILCQSAEGRASVCGHPLGIPIVVKNIARVSELATDAATGALWQICKNCRTSSVLQDLDEAGADTKLFLLLQIGCSSSTRRKAKEILRVHKGRAWKENPCFFLTNQLNAGATSKRLQASNVVSIEGIKLC